MAAHVGFHRELVRVDDVELGFFLREEVLHAVRHGFDEGLIVHGGVEQEGSAFLQIGNDVEFEDIGVEGAGDEIRVLDVIFGMDRVFPETEVATSRAAGFAGVVLEIGLRVLVGGVADDLDGALVRRNRAVAAEAIEEAARAGGRNREGFIHGDGEMGHIVLDANRESIPVLFRIEEVINGFDVLRLGVFGRKAITSADDLDVGTSFRGQSGQNVEIKRFAFCAEFFRAVEDGDFLNGSRNSFGKEFAGERAVEVDTDQTNVFATAVEFVHDFGRSFGDRAHRDDDAVRVLVAIIDKRSIVTSGETARFFEVLNRGIEDVFDFAVLAFDSLEIDIVIFRTAAGNRVGVGVQSTGTESFDFVHRKKLFPFFFVHEFHVLDFVRGTEAIEEMANRTRGFDRNQVSHRGEVSDFLDRVRADHRDAGLTDRIDILVVAENRKGTGGKATSGNV